MLTFGFGVMRIKRAFMMRKIASGCYISNSLGWLHKRKKVKYQSSPLDHIHN